MTASSNAHSTIESLIHFTSFSEQEDGEEVEEEFDLLNRLNNLNITATDQWTLVKTNRNKPKLARLVPKFPVSLWNLYNIVLLELGRSNNAVESWHGTITSDQQSHINLNKLIELFRLEQSNTENWLANLEKGTVHKRKTKAIMKDLAILNLVKTYKIENMAEYLEFMSLNMN